MLIKIIHILIKFQNLQAIPWSFPVVDPDTGKVVLNEDGTEKWTGYCIDLIDIIAKEMNFDYEIVIPKKGNFGKKIGPDKWDGLVGDLKTGVKLIFKIISNKMSIII